MSVELQMLGWSVVLGLGYVLVAAGFGTWQRGLRWNAGNRDGEPQPLNKYAARADRANRNFLETFAFFAAATLAVVAMHKTGAQTLIGAQIYFWARLAYLPVYVIGIPYLRTVIWIASLWGILQMVEALLR
ncbi:MAPEG family protein [Rhodanobacter sp. 7MK24]|uniref:MAPEG family protein n=1 Tax=Rhodanobacter sp. 7MK24 TaxID=2775922 RepID=UPI0017858397|nr:MAPEG family protein [Rhodanobacter sp. 7MK24]MBD8880858.1 MAPEG family protein [Rhodanobacter sp. 7MK24]